MHIKNLKKYGYIIKMKEFFFVLFPFPYEQGALTYAYIQLERKLVGNHMKITNIE